MRPACRQSHNRPHVARLVKACEVACQRLVWAPELRQCLMASSRRSIEQRFPLIGHLWPNMEKFR